MSPLSLSEALLLCGRYRGALDDFSHGTLGFRDGQAASSWSAPPLFESTYRKLRISTLADSGRSRQKKLAGTARFRMESTITKSRSPTLFSGNDELTGRVPISARSITGCTKFRSWNFLHCRKQMGVMGTLFRLVIILL